MRVLHAFQTCLCISVRRSCSQVLLSSVVDCWDKLRETMIAVLMALETPLPGIEGPAAVKDLVQWAQRLVGSPRVRESDAGLFLLTASKTCGGCTLRSCRCNREHYLLLALYILFGMEIGWCAGKREVKGCQTMIFDVQGLGCRALSSRSMWLGLAGTSASNQTVPCTYRRALHCRPHLQGRPPAMLSLPS